MQVAVTGTLTFEMCKFFRQNVLAIQMFTQRGNQTSAHMVQLTTQTQNTLAPVRRANVSTHNVH